MGTNSTAIGDIKNEEKIIKQLETLEGIPKYRLSFYEWGNYYLVESKLKADMLSLIASSFLFERIPFSDLVMKLLILFDSVHQKGIIINDVSSNNIFVDFTDDVY
ncbi:hypothetical protein FQV31_27870, partial [Klebsiella pneumoniae subsp. pneumoniae]|nr:hypothetical protein [Klebsiella pneumoniae subsp. pneumoniae]